MTNTTTHLHHKDDERVATIKVTRAIQRLLNKLKAELGVKSQSETIAFLLQEYDKRGGKFK